MIRLLIWKLQCGEKDKTLFEDAMQTLSEVISQTQDLSLLTDGSVTTRSYGGTVMATLFDMFKRRNDSFLVLTDCAARRRAEWLG